MTPQELARWVVGKGWVDEATIRALWSELGPNPDLLRALHQRGLLPPHAYAHLRNSLTSWSGLPRPTPSLDTTPQSFDLGALVASRYRLDHLLGKGAMGAVFRAHDLEQNRPVALKVLLSLEPRLQARFEREALAVAQVDHQGGVVRVWSAGTHAGRPFLAMELIEGDDLEALLDRGLEPRRLAEILERVAQTLEACHAKGIVHRDLKPANILVDAETGEPRVADFGLATVAEGQRLTRTGDLLGTLAYMAPEQGLSAGSVDARADVYALGAILFHGLTGQAPMLDPGAPSDSTEGVDPELEAVCLKAMRRDPADRYQSAGELSEELGRYLRGEGVRARRLGWWGRVREGWRRRERSVVVGGALVAGLGIAGVAGAGYWVGVVREEAKGRERLAEARVWLGLEGEAGVVQRWVLEGEEVDGTELKRVRATLEGLVGIEEGSRQEALEWVEALGGVAPRRGGSSAVWLGEAGRALRAGELRRAREALEEALGQSPEVVCGEALNVRVWQASVRASPDVAEDWVRRVRSAEATRPGDLEAGPAVLGAWVEAAMVSALEATSPNTEPLEGVVERLAEVGRLRSELELPEEELDEALRVGRVTAWESRAEVWGERLAGWLRREPELAVDWLWASAEVRRSEPEVTLGPVAHEALCEALAVRPADAGEASVIDALLRAEEVVVYGLGPGHGAVRGLVPAMERFVGERLDQPHWALAFARLTSLHPLYEAYAVAEGLGTERLRALRARYPESRAVRYYELMRFMENISLAGRSRRAVAARMERDLEAALSAPLDDLHPHRAGQLWSELATALMWQLPSRREGEPLDNATLRSLGVRLRRAADQQQRFDPRWRKLRQTYTSGLVHVTTLLEGVEAGLEVFEDCRQAFEQVRIDFANEPSAVDLDGLIDDQIMLLYSERAAYRIAHEDLTGFEDFERAWALHKVTQIAKADYEVLAAWATNLYRLERYDDAQRVLEEVAPEQRVAHRELGEISYVVACQLGEVELATRLRSWMNARHPGALPALADDPYWSQLHATERAQ